MEVRTLKYRIKEEKEAHFVDRTESRPTCGNLQLELEIAQQPADALHVEIGRRP